MSAARWLVAAGIALGAVSCAAGGPRLEPVALPAALAPCPVPLPRWAPIEPGSAGAGSELPRLSGGLTLLSVEGDDRMTHAGPFGAALMPDGATILSLGNGAALLWDAATGRATRELRPLPDLGAVSALAVSADGRWIAWGHAHATPTRALDLALLDLDQGQAWTLGESPGWDLQLTPSGDRLLTGGAVWRTDTRERLWSGVAPSTPDAASAGCEPAPAWTAAGAPRAPVCPAAAWLPDGVHAVEISGEGWQRVGEGWQPARWQVAVTALSEAQEPARQLATTPGATSPPRLFLAAGRGVGAIYTNDQLMVWALPEGRPLGAVKLDAEPDEVELAPDGSALVLTWRPVGGPTGAPSTARTGRPAVEVRELPDGALRWRADAASDGRLIDLAAFTPDGTRLVGRRAYSGGLVVLDATTGALLAALEEPVTWARPGADLVLVQARHRVRALDLAHLAPSSPATLLPDITQIAPDATRWLGADLSGQARLLDASGGCALIPSARQLALTSQPPMLYALSDDPRPTLSAWSAADGAPLRAARFEDGALAALLGDQLWAEDFEAPGRWSRLQLPALSELPTWARPTAGEPALTASLATLDAPRLGADERLLIDHLGARLTLQRGPGAPVQRRTFEVPLTATATIGALPRLAVGAADGQVFVLDLDAGTTQRLGLRVAGPITALAARSDGALLAAASQGGDLVVYDLLLGQPRAAADLRPRIDAATHLTFDAAGDLWVFTQRGARLRLRPE